MTVAAGDCLGRYEVLGSIGAGGMGEVWRARDSELEREVAVKVLPDDMAANPERIERFQREAKALAAISHPNLLEIYDVGSSDDIHYVVTEFLEGQSLGQYMRGSELSWEKAAEIGAAVADGLAVAHGKNIIHRDIKPANLFMTNDGRIKILDFGLAKVLQTEGLSMADTVAESTGAGMVLGTPGYMAPEQVRGEPADARSDVFALGCVLYELVAGRRAFGGNSGVEAMAAILNEEPPELSATGATVPVELEEVVHRCLQKRPEQRFQSVADLAYNLRRISSGPVTPIMATPTPTPMPMTTQVKQSRIPRWLVAAIVLVVAALTVWQIAEHRGGERPPLEEQEPTLVLNRIAVLPFANRTGDPSLDSLAALTADRLGQRLAELDEIEVAPASAVATALAGAGPESRVRVAAVGTGAGLVLSGVWDVMGDSLELQATLENAGDNTVVYAFDPIPATRTAPQEALTTLQDWALMAVQDHLYPALAFGADEDFPQYAAYREYRIWMENMGSSRWQNALELDPGFRRPRFGAALAHTAGGMSDIDGILAPLDGDEQLSSRQVHILAGLRHASNYEWEAALQKFSWLADDGHDNFCTQSGIMIYALRCNRPQRAIEAYEHLGPPPFGSEMMRWYSLTLATQAYHRLGRYDEELELVQRWQALQPGNLQATLAAIRVLAGLARLDELQALVNEAETQQGGAGVAGCLRFTIMRELRAHGHRDEAEAMVQETIDWFTATELKDRGTCNINIAEALFELGRFDEALQIFRDFHAGAPDDFRWMFGIAEASAYLGNRPAAEEWLARTVAAFDGQDVEPWSEKETRAIIRAVLGDRDEMLRLLREAIAFGYYNYRQLHLALPFEPYRDDPEFQEIVRPKG